VSDDGGPQAVAAAALHFLGDTVAHIVTSRPAARAFHVRRENNTAIEKALETRFLESTSDEALEGRVFQRSGH